MAKKRKTYSTARKRSTPKKTAKKAAKTGKKTNTTTPEELTENFQEPTITNEEEYTMPGEELTPTEKQNLQEHQEFRDGLAQDLIPDKEPLPDSPEMDAFQVERIERNIVKTDTEPSTTETPTGQTEATETFSPPVDAETTTDEPSFEPPSDTLSAGPVIPDAPNIPAQPDVIEPTLDPSLGMMPGHAGLTIPDGSAEDTFEFFFTATNYALKSFGGRFVKIKIIKEYRKFPEIPPVINDHNDNQVEKILLDKDDKELLKEPSITMIKKMGESVTKPENKFAMAVGMVLVKKLQVIPEIRKENRELEKRIKLLLAEHTHQQSMQQQQPQKETYHAPPKEEKKKKPNPPKKNTPPPTNKPNKDGKK